MLSKVHSFASLSKLKTFLFRQCKTVFLRGRPSDDAAIPAATRKYLEDFDRLNDETATNLELYNRILLLLTTLTRGRFGEAPSLQIRSPGNLIENAKKFMIL